MDPVNDCTILLVEDSLMNQRMVSAILKRNGWQVKVAKNGLEALEEMESSSFDLILMDVQMPVMDGFEATKRIRERERETKDHIPIIAMTAYDSEEDKRECLLAGMDQYISKPIDVNTLRSVVEESIASQRSQEKEKEKEKSPIFVDRESMLQQMGGDEELVKEIVEIFTQDVSDVVNAMEQALAKEDFQKLERLAHGIKGVLGNMGARGGYELGKQLELTCRDCSLEDVKHLYGLLVEHIENMLNFFSRKE